MYLEFGKAWEKLAKYSNDDLNLKYDFYHRMTKYTEPREWDKCRLNWSILRTFDKDDKNNVSREVSLVDLDDSNGSYYYNAWDTDEFSSQSIVLVNKGVTIEQLTKHPKLIKRVNEGRSITPTYYFGRQPIYQVKIGTMPGSLAIIKRVRKFYPKQRIEFAELEKNNRSPPKWQGGIVDKVEFDRIFITRW